LGLVVETKVATFNADRGQLSNTCCGHESNYSLLLILYSARYTDSGRVIPEHVLHILHFPCAVILPFDSGNSFFFEPRMAKVDQANVASRGRVQ